MRVDLRETDDVEQRDLAVRNETYQQFVALGRAPTAAEVGELLAMNEADVLGAWRRLHTAHAIVLDAGGRDIRMANPFSGIPTDYRVHADDRSWYANCAWDAFGICAALHCDGSIETSCADCGAALTILVRDTRPDDDTLLFHCLVPAAQWWDDIVFT